MIVDAVVPYHSKDKALLPWSIAGIRNYLDVSRILVVCNRDCKSDVERVGATFVDEDSVVPGLTVKSFSDPRWNWYFQQILKLGMADRVGTDYYLVMDSDTVFFKEVSFFNARGRPLYATATENHKPYFDIFVQVFGFHADHEYSFTVHHMMYNQHIVREMRNAFQYARPWFMNIVRYVQPQAPWFSPTQFNEQEFYGHYIKALHPAEVNIRSLQWANIIAVPNEQLIRRLTKQYDFCSFHRWERERLREDQERKRRRGLV